LPKEELNTFKSELKADINALRSELKTDLSELKAEIKSEMKTDSLKIIMWVVGMSFAQAAMILGILKIH
jgi:hypothetical protein